MVGSVSPGFNIDDVHRDVLGELVNEHSLTALSRQDQVEIARAWHTLRTWSDFEPALNRLRTAYPVVSFTILSTALVIDVSRLNGITWGRPQEWGDAGPPDPVPDPSIDLVVDDFPALGA
jgi:2-haloacid dehalogenase